MAKSGAARVYFDVIGRFSADRILGDTQTAATIQKAILIDTLGGINDSFMETTNQILMGVASMTDAFFEFEQQFVRVRKFYNSESVDEVNRFAEAAVKMGEGFAFTGAEALAASARTAQLKGVLGQQEAVIEAARAGLLMAQIGEMETEEGMNRFIQLAQQTQFLYGGMTKAQYDALDAAKQANVVRESSIHTLNQLNTIENSSVATMEDITFVLNQFASQANIAGESIGEMAAMSALLLETGEEVSRAGTGLRMIYQRLGNASNNATKAIAELVDGVDAQGVAQMKLTDVLTAIAPAYANMNSEQKRALAVNIAGSRHYIKFLKLMENQTRLTELQTIAFESQFPAIEEFENKQKSAAFKIDAMNAKLENQRVELGEKLAPAFMSAARAESFFLDRLEDIIGAQVRGQEVFLPFVGSVIGLGNAYQKILQPTMDLGLNIMGMVVAFRTLQAIQPQNIASVKEHVKSYQAMREAAVLQNAVLKMNKSETLASTQVTLVGLNKQQQSYTMLAVSAKNKVKIERLELEQKKKKIDIDIQATRLELESAKTKKQTEALTKRLNSQLRNRDKRLASVNSQISQNMHLAKQRNQELNFEKTLTQTLNKNRQLANQIGERSIEQLQQSVKQQQSITGTIEHLNKLRSEEVVLAKTLDPVVKQGLITKQQSLKVDIEEARQREMGLHQTEAVAISNKEETASIREKIIANEQHISQLVEEEIRVAALIVADDQAHMRQKRSIQGNAQEAMSFKNVSEAIKSKEFAQGALNGALLTSMLILPSIVDENKQMSAIMYGMALTTIPMLVKSFKALQTAIKATAREGVIMSGMMSGGLAAAGMLLGGLAAYAGFQIFDSIFGENFETNIDNLETMNSELDRTSQILADLQGAAGAAPIMESLFGDTSYNDLKQNAELTDTMLADIASRIESLNEDIAIAVLQEDTEAEAGFRQQVRRLETIEGKILAIDEAQAIVNKSNIFRNVGDIQKATADNAFLHQVGHYDSDYYSFLPTHANKGLRDANVFAASYRLMYEDATGSYIEFFQTEEEAIQRRNELNVMYSDDNISFTQDYYADLLTVHEDGVADIIANDRYLYDSILEQQNEFANAREELFFGERANFTGQIYKQVVQGGVESLLHKVELVQHNVFNGMTLPEMVDAVSQGVMQELRDQNLIS